MKAQTILSSMLFIATSVFSISASSADADQSKTPEVAPTNTSAPPASKPAAKKAKRHSHVDEKTHVPGSQDAAAEEKSGNVKADKDKTKHYHPRDGK